MHASDWLNKCAIAGRSVQLLPQLKISAHFSMGKLYKVYDYVNNTILKWNTYEFIDVKNITWIKFILLICEYAIAQFTVVFGTNSNCNALNSMRQVQNSIWRRLVLSRTLLISNIMVNCAITYTNLLRKCGTVYRNKFIFMPTYRLHSIQKIHLTTNSIGMGLLVLAAPHW